MEEIIYKNVLLGSFVTMYAYGLISIATITPEGKEYDGYRIARRVFAVVMFIWATHIAFHWHFNFRLNNPPLASTLNLSCYVVCGMLLEICFSALISGKNYPLRRRIMQTIVVGTGVNIALFANLIFVEPPFRGYLLITMAVLFIVFVITLSWRVYKTYRSALKIADNFYSDNVEIFMRWMPNSIVTIILYSFLGAAMAFASNYFVAVYMFGGLFIFTYILVSIQNYMVNVTKMKEMLLSENHTEDEVNDDESPAQISFERSESKLIDTAIERWIAQKGFTKHGLTIEELAVMVGTNRTYLSSHINSAYNLSFREWVAHLRIEYSKQLLLSNHEMQSGKIAEMVGYSQNVFIANFSKANKMTPTQWRNANM